MRSMIEGRPDQLGHSRIHYREISMNSLFNIEGPCYEASTLRHQGATQLKMNFLTRPKVQELFKNGKICFKIDYRMFIRLMVIHSQSSASIYQLAVNTTVSNDRKSVE